MMVGVTDEVWGHRMEGHRRMREEGGCGKMVGMVGIGLEIARRHHRRKKRRRQGQGRSAHLSESEASGREQ